MTSATGPASLVVRGGEADSATVRLRSLRPVTRRFAPVGRHVFDQPGDVGDTLRGGEATDRAHRAFAIERIDERANGMRHDQSRQQQQQGLSEQARWQEILGQEPRHTLVTTAVKV